MIFSFGRRGPLDRRCRAVASYDIVFPDTNILVAYVLSKSDNSLVCAVFDKVREADTLVVTNQVMDEIYRLDLSGEGIYRDDVTRALKKLKPSLVFVVNPGDADLERYSIDDPRDKPILYSADMVNARVILTNDKAWFRNNVSGVNAEIMDLLGYLYHDEIVAGTKRYDNPNAGRIKRVKKGVD